MSTIEEMKAERSKTENLIIDLLKAFEDKYGVEVSSVYLTRTQNMGERLPKLRHVTIEVKI
jgi:hypothetical protein